MRFLPHLPAALALLLFTVSCSEAQSDKAGKGKGKGKGETRKDKDAIAEISGLRSVGSIKKGVPESSGLAPAPTPGMFYSFGDNGNSSTLYQINGQGDVTSTVTIEAPNNDWESLSRDPAGNYYIGDCGNNDSDRRNLAIYRVRPDKPQAVGVISFSYPDQNEFPPRKKERNFDVEANVWNDGKLWLFTKDQGHGATSKVYTVPDQPGDHTAKLVTSLPIPGEVTDAALRADGRRLVLLGRSELFILDGNSWADILKAKPRQVALTGAGQTEGVAFKDDGTLLITTEQGGLFEFALP